MMKSDIKIIERKLSKEEKFLRDFRVAREIVLREDIELLKELAKY